MSLKSEFFYKQSAVIPLRKNQETYEILLITTRRRKRWIIPKGIVEDDLGSAASAEKEAFEEAGVRGEVQADSIGSYTYRKWGGVCRVEVFLMRVTGVLDDWPERDERQRKWVSLNQAASNVHEPGLKQILTHFAKSSS